MNVLFVSNIFSGHFLPMIYLINKVAQMGHKVTCYIPEYFIDKLKGINVNIKAIPYLDSLSQKETEENKNLFEEYAYMKLYKNYLLPVLDSLIKEKKQYDVLVTDFHFDGYGMAKALKIPKAVTIYPCSPFIVDYMKWEEVLDKFSAETNGALGRVIKKGDFCLRLYTETHGPNHETQFKFITTSKLLEIDYDKLDSTFYFIGPIEVKRTLNVSEDFSEFNSIFNEVKKKGDKLIFFSLGTNIHFAARRGNYVITLLEALNKIKGITVMAYLDYEKGGLKLPKFSEKIRIYDKYLPQLEILKHTDLCISHGGFNTVNESLFYEVPLLIIPLGYDQPRNAQMVQNLGAGVYLKMEEVTEEKVIENVQRILNDKNYKAQTQVVSKSLHECIDNSDKLIEKVFSK